MYSTAIRSTGTGTASAFGRVGGILAPIIIWVAYAGLGFSGVFIVTCAVFGVGVIAVVAFGVKTTGRALEELTEPATAGPMRTMEVPREWPVICF